MQITNPAPTFAELWDWRANVDKGKEIFAEKLSIAGGYPQRVGSNNNFLTVVDMTNQWRQSQGLEPLDQILVPDFGWYNVVEPDGSRVMRDLLVEDAVRGYNGFVPASTPNPAGTTGQFGLEWHEFWLRTQTVDIPRIGRKKVLVIENERRDPNGRLVADAIWARIPLEMRPQVGDPNYVNNVRSRNPECP